MAAAIHPATRRAVLAVTLLVAAVVTVALVGVHHRTRTRASARPVTAVTPKAAGPTAAPEPPQPGTVQVVDIAAADAPAGDRRVWVYRPGVPDSASLPVVYFLHGLPGSYRDIAAIGGKALLDRLITSGTVAPFVLAVPDGNSTKAADPEWADSARGDQRLEQFVTKTLPASVEGAYPRARAQRFIVGFSMGGYGAMNIALHHTDLYGAVSSLAGYFDTDDESGVFAGRPAVVAANRPDLHAVAARALRVMLADGSGDTVAVTRGETARFARVLRAHGVHPVVDITSGRHNSTYLRNELPRALAFLVNGTI